MLCPDSGKVCHSKGKAEAHLRQLVSRDPDYKGTVYFCLGCSHHHIGREKKSAHKNKYK